MHVWCIWFYIGWFPWGSYKWMSLRLSLNLLQIHGAFHLNLTTFHIYFSTLIWELQTSSPCNFQLFPASHAFKTKNVAGITNNCETMEQLLHIKLNSNAAYQLLCMTPETHKSLWWQLLIQLLYVNIKYCKKKNQIIFKTHESSNAQQSCGSTPNSLAAVKNASGLGLAFW